MEKGNNCSNFLRGSLIIPNIHIFRAKAVMEESSNVHFHPDPPPNPVAGKILITPIVHSMVYKLISLKMKIILTVAVEIHK